MEKLCKMASDLALSGCHQGQPWFRCFFQETYELDDPEQSNYSQCH
jgi:hypothetical protein